MTFPRLLRVSGLLVPGLLFALSACAPAPAQEPVPPQDPAARTAVLALLDTLRTDALQEAFGGLAAHPHLRHLRTEQHAPDGRVLAYRVYTVRHHLDAAPTVTRLDSAGAFDFGLFGRFARRTDPATPPVNPVPLILPEDPPYRSPRNQDQFRYRLLPDTVLFGRPVRRVDITALPGSDQTLRRARLAMDAATGQLVGLHLERTSPSVLFREQSRFDLRIRPDAGGQWVPDVEQTHTQLALLWQTPRAFQTRVTFPDADPARPR